MTASARPAGHAASVGGPGPPEQGPFALTAGGRAPLFDVRRDHLDRLRRTGALAGTQSSKADPGASRETRSADVARSLQVDLLHAEVLGWGRVSDSAWSSLAFLGEALGDDSRRFRERRLPDGAWSPEPPLADDGWEDTHGRVVLALGDACARAPNPELRHAAGLLFGRCVPGTRGLTRLRATAAAFLGCEAARRGGVPEAADLQRALVPSLAAPFEPVAWSLDWPWPEPVLTGESALSARALIVAGRRIADRRMAEMGLAILEWLVKSAAAPAGHLSPVGNAGWWTRHAERASFDQLPTEPLAILLAARTAFLATGNRRHLEDMERSYGWFLGANDLGVEIADPDRGGCRDGLGPDGARLRQGAESTLAWLTVLEHIRTSRRRWAMTA